MRDQEIPSRAPSPPSESPVNDRTQHLADLRGRIERDEYAVNPRAVADAILASLALRAAQN